MAFGIFGSIGSNIGDAVEGFCDKAGLPEPLGDLASRAANIASGNLPGAVMDGIDLVGDGLDFLAGSGMSPARRGDPGPFDAERVLADMKNGIKPDFMDEKEWQQFQVQQAEQEYSRMINLLTQLMTMEHERQMAIIRNIKG